MTTASRRNKHFIPNFEVRSVLLVTAMVLSCATVAQAQTAAPLAADPAKPAQQMRTPGQGNAAAAKSGEKDVDAAFARADTNKDSKLDKQEAQSMPVIAERFEKLDVNSDGFLSRDEFGKAAGS